MAYCLTPRQQISANLYFIRTPLLSFLLHPPLLHFTPPTPPSFYSIHPSFVLLHPPLLHFTPSTPPSFYSTHPSFILLHPPLLRFTPPVLLLLHFTPSTPPSFYSTHPSFVLLHPPFLRFNPPTPTITALLSPRSLKKLLCFVSWMK